MMMHNVRIVASLYNKFYVLCLDKAIYNVWKAYIYIDSSKIYHLIISKSNQIAVFVDVGNDLRWFQWSKLNICVVYLDLDIYFTI